MLFLYPKSNINLTYNIFSAKKRRRLYFPIGKEVKKLFDNTAPKSEALEVIARTKFNKYAPYCSTITLGISSSFQSITKPSARRRAFFLP